MVMTYRTVQRPKSDIVHWTTGDLTSEGDRRVLLFQQHKTGTIMKIAVLPPPRTDARVVKLKEPLVQTLKGVLHSGLANCCASPFLWPTSAASPAARRPWSRSDFVI